MKVGNIYFTFAEMKLQNGNEINDLAEGECRKIEEKQQSPIL